MLSWNVHCRNWLSCLFDHWPNDIDSYQTWLKCNDQDVSCLRLQIHNMIPTHFSSSKIYSLNSSDRETLFYEEVTDNCLPARNTQMVGDLEAIEDVKKNWLVQSSEWSALNLSQNIPLTLKTWLTLWNQQKIGQLRILIEPLIGMQPTSKCHKLFVTFRVTYLYRPDTVFDFTDSYGSCSRLLFPQLGGN